MKSPICMTHRKWTPSLRLIASLLTIAALSPTLAVNTSAFAQTSDDGSNSGTAAASSSADWTQFLRDNMQRWNPYETALGVNNISSLKLKWKNPGGVRSLGFQSSPAVAKGVIYFGSGDGIFYARNASAGAQLWSYTILYALNGSTGAVLWKKNARGQLAPPRFAAVVANGMVYVGNFDGFVNAFNAKTGAGVWSYNTRGFFFSSTLAVANGAVYVPIDTGNGAVIALNANTGALLWQNTDVGPSGPGTSSPAVANGLVYTECSIHNSTEFDNVCVLDASTGALLWSYQTSQGIICSPTVVDGTLYIRDGTVRIRGQRLCVFSRKRSLSAHMARSGDGASGRSAHLCFSGMEPWSRRC